MKTSHVRLFVVIEDVWSLTIVGVWVELNKYSGMVLAVCL